MAEAPSSALLFIPDISGFTRFVNDNEIAHSRLLIEELLETLIDSDVLDLKVSEIEGDAILFYRPGPAPEPKALVEQARIMFIAFHQCLKANERNRICPCEACKSAVGLTLKFVMHQGNISLLKVKKQEKLFGSDVILAHRLLKNKVPDHEYVLATESLRIDTLGNTSAYSWFSASRASEVYDANPVSYHFASLQPLHTEVSEPAPIAIRQFRSNRPLQFERYIAARPEKLFPLFADIPGRTRFVSGMQSARIEDRRHNHIIRTGMLYECLIDGKVIRYVISAADIGPGRLVLSETDLDQPVTIDWIVELQGIGCQVKIAVHSALGPLAQFGFMLFRRRTLEARMSKTLDNLQHLAVALA